MKKNVTTLSFALGWLLTLFLLSGCGDKTPTTEEIITRANELMNAGQIEDAIRILEARAQVDGERIDLLEPLAFAYAAVDDPMMAAFTFSKMAEIAPEMPEYHLYAAGSYEEAGDPASAISEYRVYLEEQPGDRAVWTTLGDLERSRGNRNAALEAYLKAEKVEERGTTQLKLGELFLQADNLAQAQRWFASALRTDPKTEPDALLGLLETALESRRFVDAEELVERLQSEFPAYLETSPLADAPAQLAAWRERQEEARRATEALTTTEAGEPANAESEEPANVESEEPESMTAASGEAQTAEGVINQPPGEVIADAGTSGTPEDNEAETRPESGTAGTSESQPPVNDPAGSRGPASAAGFSPREATTETSLSSEPSEPSVDPVAALRRKILENDSRADLWFELSQLYFERGEVQWARATASEAIRRAPDNPKYTLHFLLVAQESMPADQLLRELEKAYRKFPNSPEVLQTLARAYRARGYDRNADLLRQRYEELTR